MKEIFLVAAHISDEIQLSFISELIGNLRKEKKEFAIVSHSPIPEFLTKESKFYVYDSDNYLIPKYKIHTEGYGHRNFYFWGILVILKFHLLIFCGEILIIME